MAQRKKIYQALDAQTILVHVNCCFLWVLLTIRKIQNIATYPLVSISDDGLKTDFLYYTSTLLPSIMAACIISDGIDGI